MVSEKQKRLAVKEFFDGRAEQYHRVSRWASDGNLNSKTDEFLQGIFGHIAVDIGAGTGALISRVKGFKIRIALDMSKKMLGQIEDKSILKVVGDVHRLGLRDKFADLIICRQVLHYCNLAGAFKDIVRVLSPGGTLHIVQVIEFDNVPESWDQAWASFRKVGQRRHQRRSELEKCYSDNSLRVIKSEYLILRDEYLWDDFFIKNNVGKDQKKDVRSFFETTPKGIAEQIDLTLDNNGIAYNRLFGFWLLRKD